MFPASAHRAGLSRYQLLSQRTTDSVQILFLSRGICIHTLLLTFHRFHPNNIGLFKRLFLVRKLFLQQVPFFFSVFCHTFLLFQRFIQTLCTLQQCKTFGFPIVCHPHFFMLILLVLYSLQSAFSRNFFFFCGLLGILSPGIFLFGSDRLCI